jgi:lipopolysaccharide export system protein LptC
MEQPDKRRISPMWAVREVDHLFSRLARYTRFVMYSKWSLMVVTLLLVATLIAWPLITKDRSGMRISFVDKTGKADKPKSPVMNNPEYRGVGLNGQQYKVNGIRATQKTPALIVIDKVEAQMLKADGSWFSLTADRADYLQENKQIKLFGNVSVIDMKATNFITESATIETDTMNIYGNEAISGTGALGNILASSFEIRDNGNHIIFMGGAEQLRVTVDRKKKEK